MYRLTGREPDAGPDLVTSAGRRSEEPAPRVRRKPCDESPQARRERVAGLKRRDRIEQAMAELDERPPQDDIEFGPGRDPRVRGGLSESRRSRY